MTRQPRRHPGPDARLAPAYGVSEAARFLRIPAATLRSWVAGRPYETRAGRRWFRPIIEVPDEGRLQLSFTNLIEAHVASAITRRHRVPLAALRRALAYLSGMFPGVPHPLANHDLETDSVDLFVRGFDRIVNVSRSGQIEFRDFIEAHLRRIDRDPQGIAIRFYPFTRPELESAPRSVVIDPYVSFGRPVLPGTGIRTAVIHERFVGGETVDELAEDYGCKRVEIEEALRWEGLREAA